MVLRDSLIELMKERSILRISIKDICDLADVSRSTFYAHYKDQYDLLQQIQDELIIHFEELLKKYNDAEGSKNLTRMIEEFLCLVADNGTPLQVLISENGDINFQKKLLGFTRQKQVLKYFTDKYDEQAQNYVSAFVVTGSIGLIQQWLKNNMDKPVHDLAKLIAKLTQR
jgi:AcrR family transcriptional regulator